MLMAPPNYYKVLGVPRDADENAIKKAYRKGALKWRVPPLCCSARPPLHWRLTPRELCAGTRTRTRTTPRMRRRSSRTWARRTRCCPTPASARSTMPAATRTPTSGRRRRRRRRRREPVHRGWRR